jgi:pimeloyl-ACP methyl ester carboxylesterase
MTSRFAPVFLLGSLLAGGGGCASPPPEAEGAPPVIVVHGLGRTSASMVVLATRLERAGFDVIRFGYPSRSEPMEVLVALLGDAVSACCADAGKTTHFVTHSMGGVLVRSYLAQQREPHRGHVVMLSPPSRGSEIVDAFADSPMLQSVLGPAGSTLGTDPAALVHRLRPIRFGLGIITGDRSLNPITSWIIPGPDDGKVGVDRARLDGASFLVLPATHTFIMNRRDVTEEIVHFLHHGRFRHAAAHAPPGVCAAGHATQKLRASADSQCARQGARAPQSASAYGTSSR